MLHFQVLIDFIQKKKKIVECNQLETELEIYLVLVHVSGYR